MIITKCSNNIFSSFNSRLILNFIYNQVNGKWSPWASYSSCTKRCGTGQMTRRRSCTNPAPSIGGLDCIGSSTETVNCNTFSCEGTCHVNWIIWSKYIFVFINIFSISIYFLKSFWNQHAGQKVDTAFGIIRTQAPIVSFHLSMKAGPIILVPLLGIAITGALLELSMVNTNLDIGENAITIAQEVFLKALFHRPKFSLNRNY